MEGKVGDQSRVLRLAAKRRKNVAQGASLRLEVANDLALKRQKKRCVTFPAVLLSQRDDVNLHQNIFGQTGHFHRGAGGRRHIEVAAIDFIHGREVAHVLQEDG